MSIETVNSVPTANSQASGPTVEMVKWKGPNGSIEATHTVDGCYETHFFRTQPLSGIEHLCSNAESAVRWYTREGLPLRSQMQAQKCAKKWQDFIDQNCGNKDTVKLNKPASSEAPATDGAPETAAAFWTTTPFQIMGMLQSWGHDLDAHTGEVAAVGGLIVIAAAAALRLRCGFDTSGFQLLSQRFSEIF